SAGRKSSVRSKFQSRRAPTSANVCETFIEPRSRSTSPGVYGRTMPSKRDGLTSEVCADGKIRSTAAALIGGGSSLGFSDFYGTIWNRSVQERSLYAGRVRKSSKSG